MIRTGSTSGTGTINADGETGLNPDNDGGGGGGAGGSVVVLAQTGGLAGLTVNARGGRGTDAWPTEPPNGNPGERHGPGGGGGGGGDRHLLGSAGHERRGRSERHHHHRQRSPTAPSPARWA